MYLPVLILFVLAASTHNVHSARILAVVPTASYSHQVFYQQLWRELAIRGHDMVVITTDPTEEKLAHFKEVSIKESYPQMKKAMDAFVKEGYVKLIITNKWYTMCRDFIDDMLALPQLQEILSNKTEYFDLLMVEHLSPIAFGFKHRFKCPIIGLTSMDAFSFSHESVGNAVHSVLYPSLVLPFQADLTFFTRMGAVLFTNIFKGINYFLVGRLTADIMQKHFGEDIPSLYDLMDETDMLFVNANPIFNAVRPFAPATISIAGGIHMKPLKPLPKDLKHFLDSAREGAMYFSLGNRIRSNELPIEFRQIIMDTLAQLPYKVLWKFEDDSLPGKPDNVKIIKWAPQQDVLRHPNIKLFVTQGGLLSLEEALYSHVPFVIIQFSGEMFIKTEPVISKGLGVLLDRDTVTVENFKAAILEVMSNPEYKNKIKHLVQRIQDEPMKPLEKAVWWTEYVLRHKGAQHLKGPKLPFYQYYYLDVMAFLAFTAIVAVALCKIVIRKVRNMCRRQTKTKQS